MPENMEIKARLDNLEALLPAIARLADEGPDYELQDDTFFVCGNGRLKLRVVDGGSGVLIHYRRADELGPKPSHYEYSNTSARTHSGLFWHWPAVNPGGCANIAPFSGWVMHASILIVLTASEISWSWRSQSVTV